MHVDNLRCWVSRIVVGSLVVSLTVDVIDNVFWGDCYEVPAALFGLVGAIIGGLYAVPMFRRKP